MKTEEQNFFSTPPTLEITTTMGCKVNCKYCPQSLLLRQYFQSSKIQSMSFDTFKRCIDKLPTEVEIHFSGMSEPWLNPECTDMLIYAAEKKHSISVYTTLVGMTMSDFERIKEIEFKTFAVHLPDQLSNSRIPINNDYLELLGDVFKYFYNKKIAIETSCHGPLNPKIKDIISSEFPNYVFKDFEKSLIDRAGNLNELDLNHQNNLGAIKCKISGSHFNHNILLPDGSVLLCCMDYGMEIVLGNLLDEDYFDLFKSEAFYNLQELTKNGKEIICRKCNNAIPWEAPYEVLDSYLIKNDKTNTVIEKFCAYLSEKSGLTKITRFKPNKPISFLIEDIKNTVPLITNMNHLVNNTNLPSWGSIYQLLEYVPFVVMFMPTPNSQYPEQTERQEIINKLSNRLSGLGFDVDQIGYAPRNSKMPGVVSILKKSHNNRQNKTPSDFRVIAIISAYNEEDIIIPVINYLYMEGVDTYLIDNWSTDRTYERAKSLLGQGLIGIERFPKENPSLTYDWDDLLKRKVELANELEAGWFIHYNADEIRESPWQGTSLRDAIYKVESDGYNAIDFTIIDFPPTDNTYQDSTSLKDHFRYCEFGKRPGHFIKISAWQKTGEKLDLSTSGGHEIKFNGRKVYPIKFLMRHYPIRSQSHGEKKVFEDRKSRWNSEEKKKGWHKQYDGFNVGHNFLKDPKTLILFDENFYYDYLVERLTGIGVKESTMNNDNFLEEGERKGYYTDPNRYARSFSMEESDDHIVFHGYQEFRLYDDRLEVLAIDENLHKKSNILKHFLIAHNLKNRSVMDLGANSGYFCYLVLQNCAKQAIALEMDDKYIAGLVSAKKKFSLDKLEIITENFENVNLKTDIVIALAFIHWVYSCTAKYGSLDSVIKRLAELTNYALIIEWIAPEDTAIKFFDHISWNQDVIKEEYNYELFQKALNKYFKRTNLIGEVSPTRRVFVSYKTENDIYSDSPLPLLENKELISSRILTIYEDVEYWSDVYDGGKFIYKRATEDLALREAFFLHKLDGPFFPKVFDAQKLEKYSEIKIEKINGMRLNEFKDLVDKDRDRLYKFIGGCFDLLEQLQKQGIKHRDIRNENLFVRDDLPVLFDFGWAVSEDYPYFTPNGLGAEFRSPDGHYCDVYSMGMVLTQLNNDRYPEIADWLKLMTIDDGQYRITDITFLHNIFNNIITGSVEKDGLQLSIPLFSFIKKYNQITKLLTEREHKVQTLISQLAERERTVLTLTAQVAEREQSVQILTAQVKERDQAIQTLNAQVAERDAELISYALSNSWRITRPLRKLKNFIKGGKNA